MCHFGDAGFVVDMAYHLVDPRGNLAHFARPHAARSYGRAAEPNTTRIDRLAWIVRHLVLVASYTRAVLFLRSLFTCYAIVAHVYEDKVIISVDRHQRRPP